MIPVRETKANAETKEKKYLPDEIPAIPDQVLRRQPELAKWLEDFNLWWKEVKDILMRQDDEIEIQITTPLTELIETVAAAKLLLTQLEAGAATLLKCCEDNTNAIGALNNRVDSLSNSLTSVSLQLQNLLAGFGNLQTALSDHIAESETHGADGAIIGANTLADQLTLLNDSLVQFVCNEVSGVHKAKDIGSVDGTAPVLTRCPVVGLSKFLRYMFIEISPDAGAGAYTHDIQLGNDAGLTQETLDVFGS